MKQIFYNEDNLTEEDINRFVGRARALIINSKREVLVSYYDGVYQTVGGHLDEGETYLECLKREVMEETGIDIETAGLEPFMEIKYYSKNYPEKGTNTCYVINYYEVKTDDLPDRDKIKLTETEINAHFDLKYILLDNLEEILSNMLKTTKYKRAVSDTLAVVKEYVKSKSIGV